MDSLEVLDFVFQLSKTSNYRTNVSLELFELLAWLFSEIAELITALLHGCIEVVSLRLQCTLAHVVDLIELFMKPCSVEFVVWVVKLHE